MNFVRLFAAPAALCAALVSTAATGHAVLDRTQATINKSYRGAVTITHGCKGSPTTAVSVTIPEGVVAAKAMPKPGWSVTTVKGAYTRSYPAFHGEIASGVKEIRWTGGSLPDDQFDEFVFAGLITDAFAPGDFIRFPVVQECAAGVSRWVEVPDSGATSASLSAPAPAVLVLAATETVKPAPTPTVAGDLRIEMPTIRATPSGAKVAAGYLRITNTGTTPDRLLGGSAPFADRIEVHEMSTSDGIMKMRPLADGLDIAPGATVLLKPGSFHLMFVNLRKGVSQGETLSGTLRFQKAGEVPVVFTTTGLGGPAKSDAAPPMGGTHQH